MDGQVDLRVFCIQKEVISESEQYTRIVPLGVVEEMTSLVWTARYFSVGEVKILAPMTEINRSLLKCGNYVVKHDQYIDYTDADGNIWRRGAEIVYVKYSKDENGTEQIEARANMMGELLNRRIVFPQLVMTGTCQQIANRLFDRNYGDDADRERQGFIRGNKTDSSVDGITQDDLGGSSVDYSNEEYIYLGDAIKSVCQSGKIGFDVLVCVRLGVLGFWLYKGKDLTDGNADGNAPCVFSRDFDNVNEQEYEDSIENYKNTVWVNYIQASGDALMINVCNDPNWTDDDSGPYGGMDMAFSFRESYVDCSDIQKTAEAADGSTKTMTDDEYEKVVTNRLNTELNDRAETYSFNSSINVLSNLRYKEDFDLGDRVTCIEKSWGVTIDSRITEITQTYEAGKNTIEVTFGESSPTLLDKIKQIKR